MLGQKLGYDIWGRRSGWKGRTKY